VDVSRGIFIQGHGLKQDVATTLLGLSYVNQLKQVIVLLEDIRVTLLADFAFEFLPVVRRYVLAILFNVPLLFQPVFKALKMD